MNLVELINTWNFDFDPKDTKDLHWATNEIIGYLNEQEPEYISEMLRPYIIQAIIADLEERIAIDEKEYVEYLRRKDEF